MTVRLVFKLGLRNLFEWFKPIFDEVTEKKNFHH